MSYDSKHYDELFADLDAKLREGKAAATPSPSISITGEERAQLSDALATSIEEHRRQLGETKIFRRRQQIGDVLGALELSLSRISKKGPAS